MNSFDALLVAYKTLREDADFLSKYTVFVVSGQSIYRGQPSLLVYDREVDRKPLCVWHASEKDVKQITIEITDMFGIEIDLSRKFVD